MRKKRFKSALFGYHKGMVDAYLDRQEKEDVEDTEALQERLDVLVKENVTLGLELRVARSGFVDAAELMQAAQARARELEAQLATERRNVADLADELKVTVEEYQENRAPQEVQEIVNLLMDQVNRMGMEGIGELKRVLGDADLLQKMVMDWDAVPGMSFSLPVGFRAELEEDESSARALMHRIFHLRQELDA